MAEEGLGLARRWRALADRFGNVLIAANALLLMLASWTPGRFMTRSGVFSGHVEHTIAYAVSGALMYAVRERRSTAWQVSAMLSGYAGILELGQIVVPGRHASFEDFLFSASGAILGVLLCAALCKAHLGGK
jgi:VanZ family protein